MDAHAAELRHLTRWPGGTGQYKPHNDCVVMLALLYSHEGALLSLVDFSYVVSVALRCVALRWMACYVVLWLLFLHPL